MSLMIWNQLRNGWLSRSFLFLLNPEEFTKHRNKMLGLVEYIYHANPKDHVFGEKGMMK